LAGRDRRCLLVGEFLDHSAAEFPHHEIRAGQVIGFIASRGIGEGPGIVWQGGVSGLPARRSRRLAARLSRRLPAAGGGCRATSAGPLAPLRLACLGRSAAPARVVRSVAPARVIRLVRWASLCGRTHRRTAGSAFASPGAWPVTASASGGRM